MRIRCDMAGGDGRGFLPGEKYLPDSCPYTPGQMAGRSVWPHPQAGVRQRSGKNTNISFCTEGAPRQRAPSNGNKRQVYDTAESRRYPP